MKDVEDIRIGGDGAKLCRRTALFGGAANIALAAIAYTAFSSSGGLLLILAEISFGLGILFSLAAYVYGVLADNAAREEEEKRLLAERPESRLLDSTEDARFTAKRTFERYRLFAPYCIALLGTILSVGILWKIYLARKVMPETFAMHGDLLHLALISSLMMLFAVFSGAFFIGQSRAALCRWLRPVGTEFSAAFLLLAATTIAAVIEYKGYSGADRQLGKIFFGFFALLAAEMLVNFAVEFYRPRVAGKERPLFESRLLAIFTEPGGVMRNIADTLDYQFGFRISGTKLYALAEKSFIPLLLGGAAIFWLSTAIHEIGPGERGFRTAFGKITDKEDLTPGIYLCLPWPFGALQKAPTDAVLKSTVGENSGKNAVREVVLWTELHGDADDQFIVAVPGEKDIADANAGNSIAFIRMTIPILYRITDLRNYLVRHGNAEKELQLIGSQTVSDYLVSCSMDFVLSSSRRDAEMEMRRRLQHAVDDAKLGVEIVSLSILDAHPPTGGELDVASSYQNVIAAMEQKETSILEADAYAAKTAPQAVADAQDTIARAEAYEHQVKTVAAAESERFLVQLGTYRVMPEMFKLKVYLELLESESAGLRKFIISSQLKDDIYELDFKENDRLDLLDAQIGELGK